MDDLKGKVAIVTGASKGIGAAIARQFAKASAAVVVNYASSKDDADRVVGDILREGGKAVAIQANVSKTPEVTRLFDQAIAHFGRLDIVINNSGTEAFSPEEDVTEELYDKVFGLNTRAQFFVGQHALKHLSSKFSSPGNIIAQLIESAAQMVAALSSCHPLPPTCPA